MKKIFFTLLALCLCGTMWATPVSGDYWADGDRPTNASGGIYQDETSGLSFYVNSSGNDTTGISSVESATEGATVKGIYTLQGVRVSNMNQKGVYIVDGKKVLVK